MGRQNAYPVDPFPGVGSAPGRWYLPTDVRPARRCGRTGRTPGSVPQEALQVMEPFGRLFPVELAVKPKVVELLAAIVPL